MNAFKKTAVLFFTALFFLFLLGCEKDSALPYNNGDLSSGSEAKHETAEQPVESDVIIENEASDHIVKEDRKEIADPKQAEDSLQKEKGDTESSNETAKKGAADPRKEEPVKKEVKPVPPAPEPKETVTITVNGNGNIILQPVQVGIEPGDTVISATIRILKAKKIQYSMTGSGATAYVQGINNIYEFDFGPTSGWLVKKNGVLINRSSGSESVSNGDQIVWSYTTDFTENE